METVYFVLPSNLASLWCHFYFPFLLFVCSFVCIIRWMSSPHCNNAVVIVVTVSCSYNDIIIWLVCEFYFFFLPSISPLFSSLSIDTVILSIIYHFSSSISSFVLFIHLFGESPNHPVVNRRLVSRLVGWTILVIVDTVLFLGSIMIKLSALLLCHFSILFNVSANVSSLVVCHINVVVYLVKCQE